MRAVRLLLVLVLIASAGAPAARAANFAQIEIWPSTLAPDQQPADLVQDPRFAIESDQHALHPPDRGVHWWRLKVPSPGVLPEDPLLVVRTPRGAHLSFYFPPTYKFEQRYLYSPDRDQAFSPHALVVAFPPAAAGASILIRSENARALPLKIELLNRDEYTAEDLGFVRRYSAIHSILALMALVAFCFWLRLRDPVYLWFVGYDGAQLLYFLSTTGESMALPGVAAVAAALGETGVWFAANLVTAFGIHFVQGFAELPRYTPRLNRLLKIPRSLMWLLAVLVIAPIAFDKTVLPAIGNAVLLVSNPLGLLAAFLAWRQGSRQAGYYLIAWSPLVLASNLFVVSIFTRTAPGWVQEMVLPVCAALTSLMLVLALTDRMLKLRRERDQATRQAELDPLTAVLNRRGIDTRMAALLDAAKRRGDVFAVLYLDLDNFKSVNDRYGHAVGDVCLQAVVAQIRSELRQADSLGRHGGEEFLVLLPGAALHQARAAAERIRADIEQRCRQVEGHDVALTVSIGVAVRDPLHDDHRSGPIVRADRALYEAKRLGRNRVVVDGMAGGSG